MIDERTRELIEANLEGTLSGPELAELNRRLLGDPQTRALRDELKRVDAMLRSVPKVTPPRGLVDQVLRQAPAAGDTSSASRPESSGAGRPFSRPAMMRIAAGFAGGAVVTAAVFQLLTLHDDGLAPEKLIGTMAVEADAGGEHLATVQLSGAGAEGTAALYRSGSSLWLDVQIASDSAWDLAASYDPLRMDFRGLQKPAAENDPRIRVSDGRVRISGTRGQATYRLELAGIGEAGQAFEKADIRLALNVSGQPVAESVLSIPEERR